MPLVYKNVNKYLLSMARRRRTPEQARESILEAAQALIRESGPDALRLTQVARRAGMSHPSVVHHFGSMDGLVAELEHRVGREIRDTLMAALATGGSVPGAVDAALTALSDSSRARSLAWLRAQGKDPFPDSDESGLAQVVAALSQGRTEAETDKIRRAVELAVLTMLGDALFGDAVRQRLGGSPGEGSVALRRWLLELIQRSLGSDQSAEKPL